jgi:hypothetical protein
LLLRPPATWMLALALQLLMLTDEGEAESAGMATVPAMLATLTLVVRPAESRIAIGTPGAPMHAPVGVTLNPPPLARTTSGRTIRVESVLAMK